MNPFGMCRCLDQLIIRWLCEWNFEVCLPEGEDDEDFELNYLIDRNWEMAFLITDTLHGQQPQLTDNWAKFGLGTNGCIAPLPHTNASIRIVDEPPTSHLTWVSLPQLPQKNITFTQSDWIPLLPVLATAALIRCSNASRQSTSLRFPGVELVNWTVQNLIIANLPGFDDFMH